MRGFWLAAAGVQLAALVVTALPPFNPSFGAPVWHHNASLAVTLLAVAAWGKRFWTNRRLAGLGVAVTTLLALVSAFLLLYLKDDLKAWELKDWAKWWHVTWSWWALAFFASHTWINRVGIRRSMGSWWRGMAQYAGFTMATGIAVALTWNAWGAQTFVDGNYILLTLYTWLVVVGPPYVAWAALRRRWQERRMPRWANRVAVQNFVTLWLLPITILANISGFPILYFDTKSTDLKYVAKYWHTWPSIVMALLVFVHTLQFWQGMRGHMDRPEGEARLDDELRRANS